MVSGGCFNLVTLKYYFCTNLLGFIDSTKD
jgi:hypothetical protein